MGTSYYLRPGPLGGEELHIGKSSGGWCFSLHVIPEEGLNSLEDWKRRFKRNPFSTVRDEYGRAVSKAEMLSIITERKCDKDWDDEWWNYSILGRPSPYSSEADFHRKNGSLRGPNGLLRHQIGRFCVGHGEGTWDLIQGDFS